MAHQQGHTKRNDMKTSDTPRPGSKAHQIQALRQFVAALSEGQTAAGINRDCYFEQIVEHVEQIAENIKNDFPAFSGIYTTDAIVADKEDEWTDRLTALQKKNEELQGMVAALREAAKPTLERELEAVEQAIGETERQYRAALDDAARLKHLLGR